MMDDRREFFRIEDMAFVDTAPLKPDQNSIPEYFPAFKSLAFAGELEKLDQESKELYSKIDDDLTKNLLELQNKKLDLISNFLMINDLNNLGQDPTSVIISEGGAGFVSANEYQPGDAIAVAIIFTPSYLPIFSQATVIDCKSQDEQFYCHISFNNLSEATRQKLARHLLMQQARSRNSYIDSSV